MDLSEEAISYIKNHKKELCSTFCNPEIYLPTDNQSAYFMAGSPGAGKTEYSKTFIKELEQKYPNRKIVRIDADEVRDFIPLYDHTNANTVQRAASLGVEKLFDFVLQHKQDFVLDATFADLDKSHQNITRCLQHKINVGITYIYQDPIVAWEFTKKREVVEGRVVPKDIFINSFFSAKENVEKIKQEFGSQIQLEVIVKNVDQGIQKSYFNVDNIASHVTMGYNMYDLEDLLH